MPLFLLTCSVGYACNTIRKPVVNFLFIPSSYSSMSSDFIFFFLRISGVKKDGVWVACVYVFMDMYTYPNPSLASRSRELIILALTKPQYSTAVSSFETIATRKANKLERVQTKSGASTPDREAEGTGLVWSGVEI